MFPFLFDYTAGGSLGNYFPTSNVIDTTDPSMLNNSGFGNFQNMGTPNTATQPNYLSHLQLTNGAKYPMTLRNLLIDNGTLNWQPQVSGSTTTGTPTYVTQLGQMTESGWNMNITAVINISAAGGAAGNVLLRALPIASQNLSVAPACAFGAWGGFILDTGYTGLFATVEPNSDQIQLGEYGATVNSQLISWTTNTQPGGFFFTLSCSYNRQ
jgi:hypothetical protein